MTHSNNNHAIAPDRSLPGIQRVPGSRAERGTVAARGRERVFRSDADLRWFAFADATQPLAETPSIELRGAPGSAARLATLTVMVSGLGAVGAPAFRMFVRLGLGHTIGIDPDRYDELSWFTQPSLSGDAGKLKAHVQAVHAHAINPRASVSTAAGFAQQVPLWLLRQVDLVVAAGDNRELLVWAGNTAAALGIPLVQGAVHGETWTAFVRSYDLRDPQTACPACAFSQHEWRLLQSVEGCEPGQMQRPGGEATRTLPHVCQLAANLLVNQSLKLLLDVGGEQRPASEFTHCLLSNKSMSTQLDRNPECRCPHARWEQVDIGRDRGQVTIGMLARELGSPWADCDVRGERPWISFTPCKRCCKQIPVRRFGNVGEQVGQCRCGDVLIASPTGVCSVIPGDDLRDVAHTPLADLGVRPGDAIGLRGGDSWTYFFVGPPPEIRPETRRPDDEVLQQRK